MLTNGNSKLFFTSDLNLWVQHLILLTNCYIKQVIAVCVFSFEAVNVATVCRGGNWSQFGFQSAVVKYQVYPRKAPD